MRVVGLTGAAGCGKDTVARYLVDRHGFGLVRMAGALKLLVAEVFDLDLYRLDDLSYKETPLPQWNDRTPREILQIIGTEGFRAVDPDFWVKKAVRAIQFVQRHETPNVVIPDVRFPNEVDAVRQEFKGEIWQIVKMGGTVTVHSGHSSETMAVNIAEDHLIECASGHIPCLYQKADAILGG